jgi:protein TonB
MRALCVVFAASLITLQPLSAGDMIATAVDVNGKHYQSSRNRRVADPWIVDRVSGHYPEYPYEARQRRFQGEGLFRIIIDPATGSVAQVVVIRSTGFALLDNSALFALRAWRWKQGTWKEIEMPVRFELLLPKPRPSPTPTAPPKQRW